MTNLNERDAKLLAQLLNQLPNFLTYGTRRAMVEPVAETLKALTSRVRELRRSEEGLTSIDLTDEEIRAVTITIPEIVGSLGEVEFRLRAGYSTAEALALRDRLAER